MEDENKKITENKDESIQEINQNDIEEENEDESIKDSLKKIEKPSWGILIFFIVIFVLIVAVLIILLVL